MVDESWAIAALGDGRFDPGRLIGAGTLLWLAWVTGTAVGVDPARRRPGGAAAALARLAGFG